MNDTFSIVDNATDSQPTEEITKDDCAWILANAFLILTMQTGFGMLEAGNVSSKNVANIMVKNVIDVTVGGITYWTFGYALSFGKHSTRFISYGDFFFSADGASNMGTRYTSYVFQFSFATAATTIVSGAVAERMKLSAYIVFSAVNTFIYCIPAGWAWNSDGWLSQLGFFDFAGAGVVHMTGGASALIAAIMLGPRLGMFSATDNYDSVGAMSSPVTALTGTFMLWWAWLSFNCGSTFGIQGNKWKIATKIAVTTLNGSIGGSMAGLLTSILVNYKSIYFNIGYLINSILGGLVGITAACAVISPAEALLIGFIGGEIAIIFDAILKKVKVDDPVGAVPVHFAAAIWAVLAVGLFGKNEFDQLGIYDQCCHLKLSMMRGKQGLFQGGGINLLKVQAFGIFAMASWSMILTCLSFLILKYTFGIRMDAQEEILGADWVEHRIKSENFAMRLEKAVVTLKMDHKHGEDAIFNVLKELADSRPPDGNPSSHAVSNPIRNFGQSNTETADMNPRRVPGELAAAVLQNFVAPLKVDSGKHAYDEKYKTAMVQKRKLNSLWSRRKFNTIKDTGLETNTERDN